MAKRKAQRAERGMAEVVYIPPEKVTNEDLRTARESLEREIAAMRSLDWLRDLRDKLKPHYGPIGSRRKAHTDPVDECLQEVYEYAETLIADPEGKKPYP